MSLNMIGKHVTKVSKGLPELNEVEGHDLFIHGIVPLKKATERKSFSPVFVATICSTATNIVSDIWQPKSARINMKQCRGNQLLEVNGNEREDENEEDDEDVDIVQFMSSQYDKFPSDVDADMQDYVP
ncbi:unnamed protein product [Victoria cruziana]